MNGTPCIELTDITKRFGGHAVLDGVSLKVYPGQCVTITGENGCGKSTLLRICAGVALPSGGSVKTGSGVEIQYVPDRFPLIPISGRTFLKYMKKAGAARETDLARRLNIERYLGSSISTYSKGMCGKIGVLQALDANLGLLLLDEPVSGQDADSRKVFISEIKSAMARGCGVIMACHEADLTDALSTRVLRIEGGKLVECRRYVACGCLCGECALRASGECAGRSDNHA